MSKIKCNGGRHVRTVRKDGTWPDTCQCGKIDYSHSEGIAHTTCPCGETLFDYMTKLEHEKAGHYDSPPPLSIHVTDGVGSKDKVGG